MRKVDFVCKSSAENNTIYVFGFRLLKLSLFENKMNRNFTFVLLFMTSACHITINCDDYVVVVVYQSDLIRKSLCMSESTEYYLLSIHQLIRTAAHNSNVLELTQSTLPVAR